MTFGEKVRNERNRLGLSQDELAKQIGVSRRVQVFENDDEEAFFFLDGKTVLVESDLNYDNKSKGRKNFTLMHEGTATLFFCVDRVVLVKKEKLAKNPVFPYSHNKNACYT